MTLLLIHGPEVASRQKQHCAARRAQRGLSLPPRRVSVDAWPWLLYGARPPPLSPLGGKTKGRGRTEGTESRAVAARDVGRPSSPRHEPHGRPGRAHGRGRAAGGARRVRNCTAGGPRLGRGKGRSSRRGSPMDAAGGCGCRGSMQGHRPLSRLTTLLWLLLAWLRLRRRAPRPATRLASRRRNQKVSRREKMRPWPTGGAPLPPPSRGLTDLGWDAAGCVGSAGWVGLAGLG